MGLRITVWNALWANACACFFSIFLFFYMRPVPACDRNFAQGLLLRLTDFGTGVGRNFLEPIPVASNRGYRHEFDRYIRSGNCESALKVAFPIRRLYNHVITALWSQRRVPRRYPCLADLAVLCLARRLVARAFVNERWYPSDPYQCSRHMGQ
jgi:hypothetical protein